MSDPSRPPAAGSAEPLLFAEDLRVDVDGVPACDGLTLRTTGDRALILGCPRALFETASGRNDAVRGSLRVAGRSPAASTKERHSASCPLDPPLPPKWTALEYATWSARLAGHRSARAAVLASEALQRVELATVARLPIARLVPASRRALAVAAAIATEAPILLLEDPLAALPDEIARPWATILVSALAGRRWVVFAPRVPLTSPLAVEADEAIVATGSRVLAQDPPATIAAKERRFIARIHGGLDALGARLASRGAEMTIEGAQVRLDLGDLSTTDLLSICVETDATIVELLPVTRALT